MHGMSMEVEVFRNCFLFPLASDVRSEAIEMLVQGILCLAHVLHSATPALNQIDYALSLAGGKCVHRVGFASGSAFKTVGDLHVLTSLKISAVAWPVPMHL